MEPKKEIEEKLRAEFEASDALKAEFGGDVKAYIAFRQAESEGRIRGHSGAEKSSIVHGGGSESAAADEAAWKQEFAASEDLKAEFGGDVERYIAFKKADADGRARIHGGGCRTVTSEQFSAEVRLEEVDKELVRIGGLQKKGVEDEDEANQYAAGTPCQV